MVSIPILEEVANILSAPRIKIKYGITIEEIEKFLRLITQHSSQVEVSGKFLLCRHRSDDLILETAVVGQVKYLITRDDDIKRDLILTRQMLSHGVTVVSVQSFLELLSKGDL